MVVAMVLVLMMQVIADKIVRMIAMGNGFMATIGTMSMLGIVSVALMIRRTGIGILTRDAN